MTSGHAVDTMTRFDPHATPPAGLIEDVDADADVAAQDPPMVTAVPEPYTFSKPLVEAVEIAIALGRPLLLQGDPGSGKTRLAHAVAYRMGLPLERAYVKSTTRAADLLTTFDAVARLYDAQLADPSAAPGDLARYVRFGPFGRAIIRAHHGRRSVLLIDEIDKADLDFPNDLLHELDRLEMRVPETGAVYQVPVDRPELRPVIIVTNNAEKALPPAFLRRCIYHEVLFPTDPAELQTILALHGVADTKLATAARTQLDGIRALDLSRRPGLAELIDWVRYLDVIGDGAAGADRLDALGALIKSPVDQARVRAVQASGG